MQDQGFSLQLLRWLLKTCTQETDWVLLLLDQLLCSSYFWCLLVNRDRNLKTSWSRLLRLPVAEKPCNRLEVDRGRRRWRWFSWEGTRSLFCPITLALTSSCLLPAVHFLRLCCHFFRCCIDTLHVIYNHPPAVQPPSNPEQHSWNPLFRKDDFSLVFFLLVRSLAAHRLRSSCLFSRVNDAAIHHTWLVCVAAGCRWFIIALEPLALEETLQKWKWTGPFPAARFVF